MRFTPKGPLRVCRVFKGPFFYLNKPINIEIIPFIFTVIGDSITPVLIDEKISLPLRWARVFRGALNITKSKIMYVILITLSLYR